MYLVSFHQLECNGLLIITGCFGSKIIIYRHLGDPFGDDQSKCPSIVLHHGALLHSHLDSFSTVSIMFLVALLSCNPLTPKRLWVRCRDCPAKPMHHTTVGSQWAFHPCLLHFSTSLRYLAFLGSWASSIWSSQGTVSSTINTCLEQLDAKIKSGLSVVLAMCSGNFSYCAIPALLFHLCTDCSLDQLLSLPRALS